MTASAGHASSAKQKVLTLGTASFTIAAGKTQAVTVHLSSKVRTLLAKVHGLKAAASILLHVASGTAHPVSSAVTLHPALVAHRSH